MIASDVLGRALVGLLGFKCDHRGHPRRWNRGQLRVEQEAFKITIYVFDESVSPPVVAYSMTFTDGVPLCVILAALRAFS
jgi:hypothetical protein